MEEPQEGGGWERVYNIQLYILRTVVGRRPNLFRFVVTAWEALGS